jgi:hypothetical protein
MVQYVRAGCVMYHSYVGHDNLQFHYVHGRDIAGVSSARTMELLSSEVTLVLPHATSS